MTRPLQERRREPQAAGTTTPRVPHVRSARGMLVVVAISLATPLAPGLLRGEHGALAVSLVVFGLAVMVVWQCARVRSEQRGRRVAEREARTDSLTGVLNRRGVDEQLRAGLRGQLATPEFSVVMFDLDHFKRVNDRYGHLVGDAVLVRSATELSRVLRPGDQLGRWGGEEFVVLLSGVGVHDAARVAERLRLHLRASVQAGDQPVTASFGVASWRAEDTLETLLSRADALLYQAKRAGRNCTVTEFLPKAGESRTRLPHEVPGPPHATALAN